MKYKVRNKLWLWNAHKGSWHFFTIPPEVAASIKEKYGNLTKGWGSLPVIAVLKSELGEKATLSTSVFPDKKSGTYILPVKKSVRKDLGVQEGDILEVVIEIKK
jgi:hypothetical protein